MPMHMGMPAAIIADTKDNLAQIQKQAIIGNFGDGNMARVFDKRQEKAQVLENRLPLGVGRVLRFASIRLPDIFGLRTILNKLFIQTNPIQAFKEGLEALPEQLQNSEFAHALSKIDLQSNDPLALAYRKIVVNSSPLHRQKFTKILLNVVRVEKAKRTRVQAVNQEVRQLAEAKDWLVLSGFLQNLGNIPTVTIAKADQIAGKKIWKTLPLEFRTRGIALPIALNITQPLKWMIRLFVSFYVRA